MDFYIGLILPSPLSFVPQNFLPCDGRLLPVNQYQALFSLLGNKYGGDGQTNFALPDLRGRVVVGANPAVGSSNPAPPSGVSSNYSLGQVGGQENVALTQSQMPQHTHSVAVSGAAADQNTPANNYLAAPNGSGGAHGPSVTVNGYAKLPGNPAATLAPTAVSPAGASAPHPNLQPYQVLNWIICVQGLYPSRND